MRTETKDSVPDSTANSDPLLECLVFLTAHYGRARSAEAIRAGLAYDERGMGPALFAEAAERLGLKARIVRRKNPGNIPAPVLPAVLILQDKTSCVLLSLSADAAEIFSPLRSKG